MISERIFEEPARIGPYRIVELVGRGGMGAVFLAQHAASGERVALKRVLAARGCDIGGMRREIDALRRLQHPGVVRISDQGVEDGVPWYAMDLLEGETLEMNNYRRWETTRQPCSDMEATRKGGGNTELTASHVRPSEPPLDERREAIPDAPRTDRPSPGVAACGALPFVLAVVRRLCSTLAFVHGEGVVHRDLKSSNVMLCDGDKPILLDFGLAWRFAGAAGREVLGDVVLGTVGTAGYMAPEQIRGEMVDARADLYSLGCIFYELLTGRLPFGGRSGAEIRLQHLSAPALPPSLLVEGISPLLDDLVLRLLAKRAEDRFGHASEVAEVLSLLGADGDVWGDRSRAQSYVYRSAIVGREGPLEAIGQRVDAALAAQGGVVLVSGESGIGKTYLAMAAARDAARRGLNVVTGSCAPLGLIGDHPNEALLHPFRKLLLAIVDRCVASPDSTATLLGERAKVLAVCEPSLASLPGIAAYPDPEPLPAPAARERLLSALAQTLGAFAALSPFVLLIDDLQWADELSLRFLGTLPERWFEQKALLVVGMYRGDEETEAIGSILAREYTRRVDLARLRERSIVELVRGMLAIEEPPAGFVELIERQSEGNPFFVAEYLRTAVAERLLFRTHRGRWEIDERLLAIDSGEAALALPSSLAALVGRRLSNLTPSARRLLSVAAVLGREVERELLLDVAGLSDEEAWQPTRELVARQILEEATAFGLSGAEEPGRARLRFLHDKLREIAEREMDAELRRDLHRKAAEAIERRFRSSPELHLMHATLAHHHRQGEQIALAIEHLELAGEHALATYLNGEALAHFRDATALEARLASAPRPRPSWLPRAPGAHRRQQGPSGSAASGGRGEPRTERSAALRRARWERKQAEACYGLGDLEAVHHHVVRALGHTGHELPASTLGWTLSLLRDAGEQVRHRTRRRRPAESDPLERDMLAEAATAMHHLAERHYYSFETLPMIAASLRSVNLAERAGVHVRIATPYAMLGMAAGISKLHGLGHRYFELAREAARATGDDGGMVYSLYSKAAWRVGEGAWQEVRELCAEGATIAQRIRDMKAFGMVQTLIAHADFYTGGFQESARIYRELAETARRTGDRQHLSWGLYAGARARLALGDLEPARAMLLESNELLEQLVEVPSKIIAPGLLASVHLRLGDMDRALEMADLTAARIRQNLPTVFATVAGYGGVAEVYLAHWEDLARRGMTEDAARARRVARRALIDLMALAVNIPIGRPCHHRMQGEARRLDGKLGSARRSFEKSLSAARKLGMPHDEALARLDLAALDAPGTAAREQHLRGAEELLEQLGCRLDLARARRMLDGSMR